MTNRQMDILYYLHEQDGYVPVSDISGVIQVSVKTIRNELIVIQETVEQEKLGKLDKKPHEGVRLLVDDENWDKLKRLLEEEDSVMGQTGSEKPDYIFPFDQGEPGTGGDSEGVLCRALFDRTVDAKTAGLVLAVTALFWKRKGGRGIR